MYSSLVRHIRNFPSTDWDWQVLSMHPSVTLNALKTFNDKPWNWTLLMRNPNFNWNWVRELSDKPWNWRLLSDSEYFRWDWVREFPHKVWNWNSLSDRIEGVKTLKEFPDAPWNWSKITMGEQTSVGDILANPNFPWHINQLMFTKVDEEIIQFIRFYRSHYDVEAWCDHTAHTPWHLIRDNMDLPWIFRFVRLHSTNEMNDTTDVIFLTKMQSHLDWDHLSEMVDFESIISKHPELPWSFDNLSKNKSVKYRHFRDYKNTIPWNLSMVQLDDEIREWHAANTIKRYWKRAVTDPAYTLCRKIVLNDLDGALKECNRNQVH